MCRVENKDHDDGDEAGTQSTENDNFLDKLKDLNIIFTKFRKIEKIRNYFSYGGIDKLEDEHKEDKNAFCYSNKHVNNLINNNAIMLIDPMKGDMIMITRRQR